ncbi:MAG: serine protease [Phycisphaerae bacterium]|nr:serine protease [Phycisphaerae bacterium]
MRNYLTISLFVLGLLGLGVLTAAEKEPASKPAVMSAQELFAKASPAVVKILIYDKHSKLKAQGSGFFVSSDGLLITNYHVIANAASAKVLLPDGSRLTISGVAALMPHADLVLLKVKGKNLSFLTVAHKAPKVGTKVYAIGSPKGLDNTISEGIVSGYRDFKDVTTLMQTTAPISPGSSGGPLLAGTGKVVGITTASLRSGQNLNFAVPCKYLQALVLIAGKPRPLTSVHPGQTAPTTQKGAKAYKSFAAILREVPYSILQIRYDKTGKPLYEPFASLETGTIWTHIRVIAFNAWAKEHVTGKRLTLLLTKESNLRIQVLSKKRPEGTYRLNFSVKEKYDDIPSRYELDTMLDAQSVAHLAALDKGKIVSISGRVIRLRIYINRGSNVANRMVVGLVLDECRTLLLEPQPKPEEKVEPKPTTRPKPPPKVSTPEEKAMVQLSLARSYLSCGKKQRAIEILRSILTDFPQTKAAKQAREELKKIKSTE